MKVHELSFYSQFQCTMENCPDTCCHGWQIVLDDETIQKYMEKPNLNGFRLRSSLTKQNGTVMFKNSKGKCPFLTKEQLCHIQLSLGEEYLPEVCRIFPRQRVNYGPFAEESLFLACPEASRLFLNHLDHLYYNIVEREVPYAKSGTNEDPDYLQELLNIRHALTTQIMDTDLSRPMLYAGLLSYAKSLQQSYISNDKSNTPIRPDLTDYLNKVSVPFCIPHDVTHAILTSGFYHVFLKFSSPFLYDLCRIYRKNFRRLMPAKGDDRIRDLYTKLFQEHPETEHILRGYLSYYLLEEFLITYEDYSFLRNIATGIMHTHLLELFFSLYYEETHHLTNDDIILIITVYDRRGRHNDIIKESMYAKLRQYLDYFPFCS